MGVYIQWTGPFELVITVVLTPIGRCKHILYKRRKGDGQRTYYTYSDVTYTPRYGHAPVMTFIEAGSIRGQSIWSRTSVKYIHSRKLISTAEAQEATRAGNTSLD